MILAASILAAIAQEFRGRGRDRRSRDSGWRQRAYERDARRGIPTWERNQEMPDDVFTFARVKYTSYNDWGWRGKWQTDYPDSDLNFSYRLHQLTSLEVDPDGAIVRLTDPELYDYPMIYMIEPGDIALEPEERKHLRNYLLNGGFLLVDDFWGTWEYEIFY